MEILKIKDTPELIQSTPSFKEKVENVTTKLLKQIYLERSYLDAKYLRASGISAREAGMFMGIIPRDRVPFSTKRNVSLFITELLQTYNLGNVRGANRMVRLKVLWAVKVFNYLNQDKQDKIIKNRKPKQQFIRYSEKLLSEFLLTNPSPMIYVRQLQNEFIFLTKVEEMYNEEQEEVMRTRYSFLQVRPKEQLVHGVWEKCCNPKCLLKLPRNLLGNPKEILENPKEIDENPFCPLCSKHGSSQIALLRLGFPVDVPEILTGPTTSFRRKYVHHSNLLMDRIRKTCISDKIGEPKVGQINEVKNEDFSSWISWDFWMNGWKKHH